MTRKNNTEILNKAPLYDGKGKKEGVVDLDKKIFNGQFNKDVLYQATVMYHANRRVGLASTKVRDEVSGGGKKPWKQKGTGRARAGSIRSPLWRGGGIVFGPHPRSFKYQMPKQVKRSALIHSLNSKIKDGTFAVIKELVMDEPKTKRFQAIMDQIKLAGGTLVAVENKEKNLVLASRNINNVTVTSFSDLNAFEVMRHKNFLITEKSLELLTKKLRG